ncbi:hypothetical protein B5S28_g309 [[Candida] boidinii]|nr:hypothetical protein B5S28_g309 [[Candida] boidinii]OWB76016.1 hypothetical protein B5S32_g163 [[Candida] boidinii]
MIKSVFKETSTLNETGSNNSDDASLTVTSPLKNSVTSSTDPVDLKRQISKLISTLRGHNYPISKFEIFYIPSNVYYLNKEKDDSEEHKKIQLLTPTLITCDEKGWIVWWDLNTRRPIGCWCGHNGENVITVKQLGLKWELSADKSYNIPIINTSTYGTLLTHGKDGEIKIWKLIDTFNLPGSDVLGYKYSSALTKKVYMENSNDNNNISENNSKEKWTKPKIFFEMPVNMLNFCNVAINNENYMVTPSTLNSNYFDVYKLDLDLNSSNQPDLKRIHKSVNAITFTDDFNIPIKHLENQENTNKDLGIIMKIEWINDNYFAVGYESGHVLTFKLKAEGEISLITIESSHYPNPIMALNYNSALNILTYTSTTDSVVIDSLEYLDDEGQDITTKVNVISLKHKGISEIITNGSIISFITWDGYSRFYKIENSNLTFIFKLKKLTPSIQLELQTGKDADGSSVSNLTRTSFLGFSKIQRNFSYLKDNNLLLYSNGMSKMIVRKRYELNQDKNWLFIAYRDGSVSLYNTLDTFM